MGGTFLVALNWPKLKQNLSHEIGEHQTDLSLVEWLTAAGFSHVGGRWVVPEANLGHLNPAEVISAEEAMSPD